MSRETFFCVRILLLGMTVAAGLWPCGLVAETSELLAGRRTVQRTVFANGVTVTVDFRNDSVSVAKRP